LRLTGPRSRPGAIVAALAVTQTVGYGSLWYSFPVLLGPVTADLHAGRTAVTGAFTTAVLTAAALAVPVGRWLDRHGSRALMTTGSLLGSGLLATFAHVHDLWSLYLVWTGIGAAGALVFYEAAFATVIAWTPPACRARALLAVTVVAGFASSIFLPLTGALIDRFGWRTAALVLAVLHAAITVPLHGLVLRRPPHLTRGPGEGRAAGDLQPQDAHPQPRDAGRRAAVRAAIRDRRFRFLVLAFTAQAAALSTMTVHLIGFLVAAGRPAPLAATITGTLGVLSVTGRLVVTGLTRRTPVARVVAAVFAVQALAAAALPVAASSTAGALLGVICFGTGFGVATIARPALLLGLFGATGYATLSGLLAVPVTLATATAPLATAALQHATGCYAPVLLAVSACNALAAAAVHLSTDPPGRRPARISAVRRAAGGRPG